MKKLLLLAILALSVNAFAQTNQPPSNSTANIRGRMGLTGKWTSTIPSAMNFGQVIKPQTPDKGSLIQIIDSVSYWGRFTPSVVWMNNNKTINMDYDAKNNLTSELELIWNGSRWSDSLQYIYTYVAYHNQISVVSQNWYSGAWVNSTQNLFAYDAKNNLTGRLYQEWNNPGWDNVDGYTYTYDAKNNLINEIEQIWNNPGWTNYEQYFYTYDSSNNQIMELDQSWNDINGWESYNQYTVTYNVNNYQTSRLLKSWNGGWVNYEKDTLIYDSNNNLTSKLEQRWIDSVWVNNYQYTYTYDSNRNLTSEISQFWLNNIWVYSTQQFYTYDVNNFLKSVLLKSWNSTGTGVMIYDSTYYYFHTVLGINELKLQDAGIAVYPNPSSERFTISSKSDINAVEVYNLLGEQVYHGANFNGKTSTEIDLSSHSKGTYILNVHSGTKVYNCMIVVQ